MRHQMLWRYFCVHPNEDHSEIHDKNLLTKHMVLEALLGPFLCRWLDARPIEFCRTNLRQRFVGYQIHPINSPKWINYMILIVSMISTWIKHLRYSLHTLQTFSNSNSRILWMLPCCFFELVCIFFLFIVLYQVRSGECSSLRMVVYHYHESITILTFLQQLLLNCILDSTKLIRTTSKCIQKSKIKFKN